jgi:hypothetical protein
MAGLYPHLLSYYSEGVGGLPGATKLGLETTYWCETCASAIPYLNAHAKPGDVILMEGSYVYLYYQEAGLLRKDVSMKEMHGYMQKADWYIFEFRQSQYGPGGPQNYSPLQILQTQTPVFEVNYQGVPMLNVYGAIK